MAESFLSASFGFACDNAEMDLLAEAFQAASDLMVDFDPGEPSAALLALFPPTQDGTPWSGLRDIFDDPAFPDFGAEVASDPCAKEPGRRSVVIYGLVDFQPEPIGQLIFRCCKATLLHGPIGFEWTMTCSKPRAGEFSGGWCAIFHDRIEIETTREALAAALSGGIV